MKMIITLNHQEILLALNRAVTRETSGRLNGLNVVEVVIREIRDGEFEATIESDCQESKESKG